MRRILTMNRSSKREGQLNKPETNGKTLLRVRPRGFCAGVVRAVDIVELALEEVPIGAVLVFSAHGVPPTVRDVAKTRSLRVIDATCPLVTKVHLEALRFAREKRTIILIGHRDHQEIVGTSGEAPEQTIVVDSVEDVDLILVVGSPNSSNSNRLVEVAKRSGVEARLIDEARDIDLAWLEGVRRVGLTAGASAPEVLVEQVSERLASFGYTDQRDLDLIREDVRFTLPPELATIAPARHG